MALKRKITKDEYDALPEVLKNEYKGDGAGYVLDTDTDDSAVNDLRSALDRVRGERATERDRAKALKEQLDEIQHKIDAGILSEAEGNKDITKLKEIFTTEREQLRTELTGRISVREAQLIKLLVDGTAESMARELAGDNWALMLPHVKARLSAEFGDDEATLNVLGEDGKPSTLSVKDLKAELLKSEVFAPILKGVDSSGGGAARNGGGGAPGNKKPEDYTAAERTELYRINPALFNQLFPVKG